MPWVVRLVREAEQRWQMEEGKLPAGSIVLKKPPNVWEGYKRYVFAFLFLLMLQGLIIAGLLWQRARRKKLKRSCAAAMGVSAWLPILLP